MTKRQVNGLAAVAPLTRIIGVVGVGLLVANCAGETGTKRHASREVGAFPEAKYGKASPRVVDNGERAPKGGGRYLVGKSYTVAGKRYTPREMKGYPAIGMASWYGEAFHGRRTANGEVYDMSSISAAHPTMPLPSYARVTNLRNNRSMMVRVNDRGPFHGGRVMDVSEKVAFYLDFKRSGTAKVKIDYIGPASIAGSDDRKLLATLRTDEAPAIGGQSSVMVASADMPSFPTTFSTASSAPAEAAPATAVAMVDTAPANRREETAESFRVASNIPLPPDRPFEAGGQGGVPTAPRAASVQVASLSAAPASMPEARPVVEQVAAPETDARRTAAAPRAAAPATALGYVEQRRPSSHPIALPSAFTSNAQLAALYYAAPDEPRSRFGAHGDPMVRVKTTHLVPFNAVPTPARAQLVVQAGVFRDHANALKLASTLGKSAQVKAVTTNGAAAYQVTAGPFASQAQAEAVRARAVDAGAKGARLAERG
jgi:rare lipoprotein A